MYPRINLAGRRKPLPVTVVLVILLVTFVTFVVLLFAKISDDESNVAALYGEGTILSWPFPLTTSDETTKILQTTSGSLESKIPRTEKISRLKETFSLLDTDSNNYLIVLEISAWISSQVKQHMQKAVRENILVFTSVDSNPRNGLVSWEEYHSWFLQQQGFNETYLKQHDEKHNELQRKLKERISWDQAAWQEAARTDPKSLNLDEFLGFRHPEASHTNLLHKVEELLSDFDEDVDEALDWKEFSAMPDSASMIPLSQYLKESDSQKRRQNEFKNFIDKNQDGKIEQRELLNYLNPSNSRHAVLEAEILMQLSDKNNDSQLDLNEVLDAVDYFFASKVLDAGDKFHDEF